MTQVELLGHKELLNATQDDIDSFNNMFNITSNSLSLIAQRTRPTYGVRAKLMAGSIYIPKEIIDLAAIEAVFNNKEKLSKYLSGVLETSTDADTYRVVYNAMSTNIRGMHDFYDIGMFTHCMESIKNNVKIRVTNSYVSIDKTLQYAVSMLFEKGNKDIEAALNIYVSNVASKKAMDILHG